jgi:hypothetical protein
MYKVILYYLWIAPHALLAVLAVLMFLRGLHGKFPIFFIYTLYEVVEFLLLFATRAISHNLGGLYRDVFIATAVGSAALRFGIIQEIFNNIFHDYSRLMGVATASMRWLTGILLVGAVLLAVYSSGSVSNNMLSGVMLLDRSVAVIQAGLLLFLFLFSRMFGVSWRSYTFGIALGFGIFASTELAYWAMRLTDLSEHAKDLLDLLPTGSYHISILVWLGYLLTAEKPVNSRTYTAPELDQWSGELERSR